MTAYNCRDFNTRWYQQLQDVVGTHPTYGCKLVVDTSSLLSGQRKTVIDCMVKKFTNYIPEHNRPAKITAAIPSILENSYQNNATIKPTQMGYLFVSVHTNRYSVPLVEDMLCTLV